MAKQRALYFYRSKHTGDWIAAINTDGSYSMSSRMQDAMLFLPMHRRGGRDYEEHYVITRAFKPPRPRYQSGRRRFRVKAKSSVSKEQAVSG